MSKKIALIQGHPDAMPGRYGRALLDAYRRGAVSRGHETRTVDVASLDFPMLRSKENWEVAEVPASLRPAQEAIFWADHLVLFFPLWLGGMPALTKGLLEQVLRPGFAIGTANETGRGKALLKGRSARIVVTMGMPALIYRFYFRAHSLKALERSILGFVGIAPIRETLVGSVESLTDEARDAWLRRIETLGREGG